MASNPVRSTSGTSPASRRTSPFAPPQVAAAPSPAATPGPAPLDPTAPLDRKLSGDINPDIEALRNELWQRINQRRASAPDSLGRNLIAEDERRVALLDALMQVVRDPTYAKNMDAQDQAQLGAANLGIQAKADAARGQSSTGAAARGLLGGSAARADMGKIGAQQDQQSQQAARSVVDARRAADESRRTNLYDFMQSQILAPSALATGGASTVMGREDAISGLNQMDAENTNRYRSNLSNALGSVIGSTITPGIQGGFRYADRANQADVNAWQADYANGKRRPQPAANRTWWGL